MIFKNNSYRKPSAVHSLSNDYGTIFDTAYNNYILFNNNNNKI